MDQIQAQEFDDQNFRMIHDKVLSGQVKITSLDSEGVL